MIREGTEIEWLWGNGKAKGTVKEIHYETISRKIDGSDVTRQLMSVKRSGNKEAEIREAITYAAKKINNRYATCRKHYVHPKILENYENSGRSGFSRLKIEPVSELQQAESMLMRLLET